MASSDLLQAVEAFVQSAVGLSDVSLGSPIASPMRSDDRWPLYDSHQRELFYHVYQALRELAVDINVARAVAAPPTMAQRVLAQHQIAWREFFGALAGVIDDEVDRIPAEDEWSIRTIVEHVMGTELIFLLQIEWAIARRASGEDFPVQMPHAGEALRRHSEIDASGSLADILERYDTLHDEVLRYCTPLTDADLDTPSVWWEEYPFPVRYRMQRWDAHLREHTVQVDKTLAMIGREPRESERLVRLIYSALGECEGALIGAPEALVERQREVAAVIDERARIL